MSWITISVLEIALAGMCFVLILFFMRGRKANRRFQILADVAAVSDRAGTLEQTFGAICDILVPEFADFCMIDVIEGDTVRRAAVRTGPGAGPEVEPGLGRRRPSVPTRMVEDGDGDSLAPRFIERMSEEDLRELAHDDGADLEFLRGLGMRSAITVALQARGQVTGALTMAVAWSGRRYRRDDSRFAWILSGRVALALDNSGLFADLERAEASRAEIAETLQHGLLPSPLPHIPGWSLAAMYRPAGAENEVGGDFYDAFQVAGGWMVVIGDVTGRGAQAASVTALVRYTLRTAALLTNDPLVALATLNRALLGRRGTALCGIVALVLSEDPQRPVRLAVAGHLPPLLVDGAEVSEAAPPDPVLGAFPDVEWGIGESLVEPGQQLVLVTDGVTEATGGEERFGEHRLRAHLAGAGNPAHAVQRLETALHSFTDDALDDDAAIIALTRTEPAPPPSPPAEMSPGAAMSEAAEALVGRLFHAFNQRDEGAIVSLCADDMELIAVTGAETGHPAYRGRAGLSEYLADVERVWEELLITSSWTERRGDRLLVLGRVYVRSHERGIRDMPVAWIWRLRAGRFVHGEGFTDPDEALTRFAAAPV